MASEVPCKFQPLVAFTHEILVVALATLKKGRTRGADARDDDGEPCSPNLMNGARSWSVVGAIYRGYADVLNRHIEHLSFGAADPVREMIIMATDLAQILVADEVTPRLMRAHHRLYEWNDDPSTTNEQVFEVFRRLIAATATKEPHP